MRTGKLAFHVLLTVVLASLLIVNVCAADVEITTDGEYAQSNRSTWQNLRDNHPSDSTRYSAVSQSFCTLNDGNQYKIKSVKLDVYKYGSPTGNAYVRLYAHSGTFGTSSLPTGDPLATSDPIDVSTLPTSEVDSTFTFSGAEQITLSANTYYCIDFENPATGTIDNSNCVNIGIDATSPTHEGNYGEYRNGAWSADSAQDVATFGVYGELAGGPSKNLTTSNLGISVSAHNAILAQINQPAHLGIQTDAHTAVMAKVLSTNHLSLALASRATTTIAYLFTSHLALTLGGHAATLTGFLFPSHLTLSMNLHNALSTAILDTQHLDLNLQMHNKLTAFIWGSTSTINYIAGSLNVQTASSTATPTTLIMVLGLAALAFIIAIVALCIALTKKG